MIVEAKLFLRQELQRFWDQVKWPSLPEFSSDLNDPAVDLMTQDTFVAGCFQQIIDTGTLPDNFHGILKTDSDLTLRLECATDKRKVEFLIYKYNLDMCINIANLYLELE